MLDSAALDSGEGGLRMVALCPVGGYRSKRESQAASWVGLILPSLRFQSRGYRRVSVVIDSVEAGSLHDISQTLLPIGFLSCSVRKKWEGRQRGEAVFSGFCRHLRQW